MSSSNTTVPKGKEKKPSLVAKKPPTKPIQAKKPEPLYHLLGKERVKFIGLARKFAEVLRLTYGDEMSINKFSRILVELQGQKSLSELIHLDQAMLDMFCAYNDAKHKMIDEQNSFKSSYSTPPLKIVVPSSKEELFGAEPRSVSDDQAGDPESFLEGSGSAAKPRRA
jgi:hypothetical protein